MLCSRTFFFSLFTFSASLLLSLSLHAEGFSFDILWPCKRECVCVLRVFSHSSCHGIFIRFRKSFVFVVIVNLRMCHNFLSFYCFIAVHCIASSCKYACMYVHTPTHHLDSFSIFFPSSKIPEMLFRLTSRCIRYISVSFSLCHFFHSPFRHRPVSIFACLTSHTHRRLM